MSEHDTLAVLREILDLGEAVEQALINHEFEKLQELIARRGTLVEQLRDHEPPNGFDPEWEVLRVALTAQHRRLRALLAETEQKLTHALVEVEQYKQAQRQYQGDAVAPRGILRAGLQG